MDQTPISEEEVLRNIESTKQSLQDHKLSLNEHIYNAMDGFSRTALQYIQANKDGWASSAKDSEGNPIWSAEQAKIVEEAVPMAIQKGGFQVGGALDPKNIRLSADSSLISPLEIPNVSLDKIASSVSDFLTAIDKKNREIAMAVGPVAFINKMEEDPGFGPILPYLPVRLQFPARLILPVLNSILEACRLLVITNKFDNPMLRKILSVVLAIFDVSRGEWRDGVMSLLGVINREALLTGLVIKTTRFIYNFISPDIQNKLQSDLYAGSKSMFIGAWLWLLSVAAPDFVRATINDLFNSSKEALEEWKKTLEPMQQKAQELGKAEGLDVKFPEIPLSAIPSFADIQNLQSILHQKEVTCNSTFQAKLKPSMEIPAVRVLLELLNIPTTPEATAEFCKGQPTTMADAVTEAMTPTVTPIPVTQGGKHRRFHKILNK